MSDIMQFIRELLEGQAPGMAIRGTVTHAVKVPTEDPTDPDLYELQIEVQGYTYSGLTFTRDPNLSTLESQLGIEVLVSKPAPGAEGYPTYLYMVKAPVEQATPQQPQVPQAPAPQPQKPAQPLPPGAAPQQEPLQHGVQNSTPEQWAQQPQQAFDPNAADMSRMQSGPPMPPPMGAPPPMQSPMAPPMPPPQQAPTPPPMGIAPPQGPPMPQAPQYA